MRVFEEASKADVADKVHCSDIKYKKSLEKRDQTARKVGCFIAILTQKTANSLFQKELSSKRVRKLYFKPSLTIL